MEKYKWLAIFAVLLILPTQIVVAETSGSCTVNNASPYPTIQAALDDPTCDPILVDPAVFNGVCLTVERSVTIIGSGIIPTMLRGLPTCAVIEVDDGTAAQIEVNIHDMSLVDGQNGITSTEILHLDNVLLYSNEHHGIFVTAPDSVTTINAGQIVSNGSQYAGAGIFGYGTISITDSLLASNGTEETLIGGAISSGGSLLVRDTLIAGNRAQDGGGLHVFGSDATVENVLFKGNTATGTGGAVLAHGALDLVNVTISDNSAEIGSALAVSHINPITLNNVTIAENTTNIHGFGVIHISSPIEFRHTIIADNIGIQCTVNGEPSLITSLGHNIESTNSCNFTHGTDFVNADPQLAPLASNGGPTQTYALLPNSPAIDAGNNTFCPATDQRGVTRPLDGPDDDLTATCDIGAYEFDGAPTAVKLASAESLTSQLTETETTVSIMLILLMLALLALVSVNVQFRSNK